MIASKVTVQTNRKIQQVLGSLGGVSSPEMLGAARALRREIKKTLGINGKGDPAPPGQPPAKQSGTLQKSVKSGAVGAAQRVAATQFTAPLLEFGVNTRADGAAPRSRRDLFTRERKSILRESLKAFSRKLRRRQKGGSTKVRHQVLEPRPFMERSLAAARDEMVAVAVSEIRRRTPGS